jgi:hypothetical protein
MFPAGFPWLEDGCLDFVTLEYKPSARSHAFFHKLVIDEHLLQLDVLATSAV